MKEFIIHFIQFDGYIFLLMGLIYFTMPGQIYILKPPVNEVDSEPLKQANRQLAALFISIALLLIVIGRNVTNGHVLKEIAIARVISLELIFLLMYIQFKSKKWKNAPLIILMTIYGLMSIVYLYYLSI